MVGWRIIDVAGIHFLFDTAYPVKQARRSGLGKPWQAQSRQEFQVPCYGGQQLGVTLAALSRILNGHAAISADMALRLQDWLGINAQMWLRMQAAYDLWQAQRNQRRPHIERLKHIA